MISRSLLAAMVSAATLTAASRVFAADEYNVSNGITLTGNPLGLHGIDPVSMFKDARPTIGDAVRTTEVNGVDYYFASETSRQAYEAQPAANLQPYGGFCALGVSLGKKLDGDVRYADIVDGKL